MNINQAKIQEWENQHWEGVREGEPLEMWLKENPEPEYDHRNIDYDEYRRAQDAGLGHVTRHDNRPHEGQSTSLIQRLNLWEKDMGFKISFVAVYAPKAGVIRQQCASCLSTAGGRAR